MAAAGERFDASALMGSVSIANVAGDLYVGRIEAADAVYVKATGGVYDALDRSDLDDRTSEERLQSWKEAGLLDANGAGVNRYAEDLKNAEDAVKNDFARYLAYEEANKKTLTSGQQSDYATLKTRFEGCADAAAAIEKEKADSSTDLYKVVAGQNNYGWDASELLYAVADSVINPTASSSASPDAASANIAAKTVTIETGRGIGQDLDSQTKKLTEVDEAFLKLLSRAESGDLKISKNESEGDYTLTLNLKRSVSVHLTDNGKTDSSSVSASATTGNIYLESANADVLRVNQITGTGNVTLNGAEGIVNAAGAGGITGKNIVLNAHLGSIATTDSAVKVTQSKGAGGWVQLTAAGLVNVQSDGNLDLYSVSSNSAVNISADKIRAWHDDQDVGSLMGYINAGDTITLTANGIGLPESDASAGYEAIRVSGASTVVVKTLTAGTSLDGVYLIGAGAGTLTVKAGDETTLKAGSVVLTALGELDSDDKVKQAGHLSIQGNWEAGDFTALAAGDLKFLSNASIKTTSEAESLELTADNVYAAGLVAESAKDLTIRANKQADLENATLTAKGNVVLEAENDTLNVKNVAVTSTNGGVTITAGAGDVDVSGSNAIKATNAVAITAANGAVKAASKTIEAGSVSLSGKTGVTLTSANLKSTGETNVSSTAGSVSADGVTVVAGGLSITGKKDVSAKNVAVDSSNGVTITADSGNVDVSGSNALNVIKATNAVAITATNGVVSAASKTIEADTVSLSGASGVTLTSANLKSIGATNVSSTAGSVSADGLTVEASGLLITGSKGVSAKNVAVDSSNGVTITADSGNVDVSGSNALNAIKATNAVAITATNGVVNAASKTIEAGSVSLSGKTGVTADNASITSKTDGIKLESSSGSVAASKLTANAQTTLAVSGASGVTLTSANLQSIEATNVSSSTGSVSADGLRAVVGGLSITGKKDVSAKGVSVNSTGGVTITADSGNVDVSGSNTINATTAVAITATNGAVNAASKTIEAGSVSLSGKTGVTADDASITSTSTSTSTAEGINLESSSGSVAASNLTANAKTTLAVSGASGVNVANSTLRSTSGALTVTSSKGSVAAFSIKATSASDLAISGQSGVTLLESAELTSGGDLSIASTSGDVKASGVKTTTSGDLTVSAGGAVVLDGTDAISAKSVTISAGNGVNVLGRNITATAGDIAVSSKQGDIEVSKSGSATALTATNGTVSVTAESGAVNADGETFTAKSVHVSAGGDVNADSVTISATGDVSVDAGGELAMRDLKVSSTTNLRLAAGKGDVDLNNAEIGSVSKALKVTAARDILAAGETITTGTAEFTAGNDVKLESSKILSQGNVHGLNVLTIDRLKQMSFGHMVCLERHEGKDREGRSMRLS